MVYTVWYSYFIRGRDGSEGERMLSKRQQFFQDNVEREDGRYKRIMKCDVCGKGVTDQVSADDCEENVGTFGLVLHDACYQKYLTHPKRIKRTTVAV